MLRLKVNKNTFNSVKNKKLTEKIFFNKNLYRNIDHSTTIQWVYRNENIYTRVYKVQLFKDVNDYKIDFSTNEKNKEYYDNVKKYGIKVVNFSLLKSIY
jgi:hypothetical protein